MDAINTVVPRALAALFSRGPMSQGKLEVAWRVAVGDAIARATTVRLQDDGNVAVQAADARWRKELTRSTPVILGRLQSLLGRDAVKRLMLQ